jgi:hypothetical protein
MPQIASHGFSSGPSGQRIRGRIVSLRWAEQGLWASLTLAPVTAAPMIPFLVLL